MVGFSTANPINHKIMEALSFNFSSCPDNRFPLYDADGNALDIVIDKEFGVLRIILADQSIREFPLTQDDEPFPQAIMITQNSENIPILEIGTVNYLDQPIYLEDYPLNETAGDPIWKFAPEDGGIVILDIRNLGRQIATRFHFDMVPVQLSLTGIYLRIATLKYFSDSGLEPWYEQIEFPLS